ncbi:unnamed protein product [Ostreobium quekettii]|uniref:Uncharacterized protein n=1 Tax=Ostreobium quekettii TaxID=121088 RepID=A0A8S1J7W3_9CHLO|nr:unnamed protein product [Ostreobium quekettii]
MRSGRRAESAKRMGDAFDGATDGDAERPPPRRARPRTAPTGSASAAGPDTARPASFIRNMISPASSTVSTPRCRRVSAANPGADRSHRKAPVPRRACPRVDSRRRPRGAPCPGRDRGGAEVGSEGGARRGCNEGGLARMGSAWTSHRCEARHFPKLLEDLEDEPLSGWRTHDLL